ncbi:MAG: S24 family peptidase [Bacteroidia bacterium]|nr:S24 family peptidase [Bacteroidia bacterium]
MSLKLYKISAQETPIQITYVGGLRCGSLSPTAGMYLSKIDLNEILKINKDATFMAVAEGISNDGFIQEGDRFFFDRGEDVHNGDMVICMVDQEATVKEYELRDGIIHLKPMNKDFPEIIIDPKNHNDVSIEGVVTLILRPCNERMRRRFR